MSVLTFAVCGVALRCCPAIRFSIAAVLWCPFNLWLCAICGAARRYWHNALAKPGMERFTPQINSTEEPRQSSSYSSSFIHNSAASGFEICVLLSLRPRQVPHHEPTENGCWSMIGHLSWVYGIPVSLVPRVPTKTDRESRICNEEVQMSS